MTDVTLVNLTPHDIVILSDYGRVVVPPTARAARVDEPRHVIDQITLGDGVRIEVVAGTRGTIDGLPSPTPGTLFVVSRLVAERCPDRNDLLYPTDLVRDPTGTVIACRRLARPTPHVPRFHTS